MGFYAEETAKHYQFTREQQDAYALTSLARAKKAVEDGTFSHEIVPVEVATKKGAVEVVNDEQPLTADPGQDTDAEACLCGRRFRNGGEFEFDFRWRRGTCPHAPFRKR